MAALSKKLRSVEGGCFMFRCPGCRESHLVGPSWSFNGDVECPTFQPSILVAGKQVERDDAGKWTGGWVRGEDGEPLDMRCHSYVTDGQIQFLGDCTHALAGQTVPLPDMES